jgi:hypothetical protein
MFFTKMEPFDPLGPRMNRTGCGLLHQEWNARSLCQISDQVPDYDVGFTVLDAGLSVNADVLIRLAIGVNGRPSPERLQIPT